MTKLPSLIAGRLVSFLPSLLIAFLIAGCATSQQSPVFSPVTADLDAASTPSPAPGAPTAAQPQEISDRFAVGDLVRVMFSGTTESIQPHEERIKDDGTITLPFIGAIKAEAKTSGELQKAITDAYVPDYYKRLTVTVTSDRRVYYVGGQVRVPGRQEYIGSTTVTKAIQSAGDFNDYANRKKVVLTRVDGKTITVNCIKAAKDPSLDLPVFPGDKIHVPMRVFW
jgi:polysaccharide export outer membrane protein